MLRLSKYLIILTLLTVISVPIVLVVAGLQPEPLVLVGVKLAAADVARAKALIESYDPRRHGADGVHTLEVPEADLSLLLGYGVSRLVPAGIEVDLREGAASLSLTAKVPENPLGRYFNARADLVQVPGGIEMEGLLVGRLRIPGFIASPLVGLARRALEGDETFGAVLASVNGFRLAADELTMVYQWRPELLDRMKARGPSAFIGDADRERLLAYSEVIAAESRAGVFSGKIPLTDLLSPVFAVARERARSHGDAAAENRGAIIALMLYIQGVDIARLLDEPADDRYRAESRPLTLQGRTDFAQHFLISAGIAAAGGSRLADAVGLLKEIEDSRGGSGFSFTDLAADRAGVRFAETATGSGASTVQDLIADGAHESVFMPEARDLPEFMPESEFVRRFGGVGAPGYQRIADKIEQRIAALDIHR